MGCWTQKAENMRILLWAGILSVVTALSPAAAQEAKQNFTLINKTGYELKELYVGPTASEDWGPDIMGDSVIGNGQSVNVRFSPRAKTCQWDLKVVYSVDDSSAVWSDINLCEVEKVTIRWDKNNNVTRASFD